MSDFVFIVSTVISCLALCVLVGLVSTIYVKINDYLTNVPESFQNFPKASDAYTSGQYDTMGKECAKGTNKCYIKNPEGTYHYFCSKNCEIPEENVKGTKVEEPMDWQVRYA